MSVLPLYSFLVFLASLVVLPITFFLDLGDPRTRRGWRERLGWLPEAGPGERPVWIQAVSVGEVQLAGQLMEAIRARRPDLRFLLTSTTAAGRRLAGARIPPGSRVAAFPLDLPPIAAAALRRGRPRMVVLMETEIWPNFLEACARSGVPVVIANGRISPRSYPRYRAVRGALASALRSVSLFLMQSEADGERIRALGASAERVEVPGNLKWDLPEPTAPPGAVRRDLGLPEGAPVLLGGSTFEGEEAGLLDAWATLRREFPGLRIVLAPRHPHRFDAVAELLARRGIGFARRSAAPAAAVPEALLLDTIGDLRWAYAAGTVCFVGGSLVRRGGQNLLEPAAAGRPVLFGPRTENFAAAADALLGAGAGFRVADDRSLADSIRRLLADPAAAEEAGRRGRDLVAANRGATARVAGRILERLGAGGP